MKNYEGNKEVIFLSPRTKEYFSRPDVFGCIFGPDRVTGGQWKAATKARYILENRKFYGKWSMGKWVKMLMQFVPYQKNCICALVPDEPFNRWGTMENWHKFKYFPRALGYKLGFVTQTEMEVSDVPWQDIGCLFIGGNDNHKRGYDGWKLASVAAELGIWVHIGRGNTGRAIEQFWPYANSVDGTSVLFNSERANEIAATVTKINEDGFAFQPRLFSLPDEKFTTLYTHK